MSDQKDINSANVEKCLAEINEVFRDSDESLDRFAKRLVEIALDTEQLISDTANVAQEFSRQGLDIESVLKRTRDTLILSRLSNIGTVDSVKNLSAAISAFSQEGLDSTDILNRIAIVDAKFSVSAKDLSDAIARAGDSAKDAEVSFGDLLALVCAAKELTATNGDVIGQCLDSIFKRFRSEKVISLLELRGILTKDEDGKPLGFCRVAEQIVEKCESDPTSLIAISEVMGGIFAVTILRHILADKVIAKRVKRAIEQTVKDILSNEVQKGGFLTK